MTPASPNMRDPLIVGVDIGGTKTQLRALGPFEEKNQVVPSTEWRMRDWDGDARKLVSIVRDFVGDAPVAALGVGAHGCDDAEECALFEDAISRLCDHPVSVVNDAELMPYAAGLPGQIGLVAGTGSIAVHRDEDDVMRVAGGWGWVIGDEGSASGLMRDAVRAVAMHLDDGGDESEPLVARVLGVLVPPRAARLGSVFSQIGRVGEAGKHAHVIFEAADAGSSLAQDVIRCGAEGLADLIRRLERQGAKATHVVAGGGVIASQPRLWHGFEKAVADLFGDRITPVLFSGAPVEGACQLAHDLLGRSHSRSSLIQQY